MKTLILTLLMILALTTPVLAQQDQEARLPIATSDDISALKNELAALQNQIAALIKGRGEDQRVISELRTQLTRSAARSQQLSDKELQEVTQKRNKTNLNEGCESYDMKLKSLQISLGANNERTLTVICQ